MSEVDPGREPDLAAPGPLPVARDAAIDPDVEADVRPAHDGVVHAETATDRAAPAELVVVAHAHGHLGRVEGPHDREGNERDVARDRHGAAGPPLVDADLGAHAGPLLA